jgi:ATP-dependent helicase Lhr and Lhr-like helicase
MILEEFHPVSRAWFQTCFAAPTQAQQQAWTAIKSRRHTLIAAPTGSGKTLAAFYAAIDDLLRKGLRNALGAGVQIVYVSPLKALSNDIHCNLEVPLNGIAEQLHCQGYSPVDIRMAVRTGDTPQNERQKMARNPPHILVTTPESLYLLLTSSSGRRMLATAETLIVDEIHALLGDKRGSHLALSIERLHELVGGKLQRIGLSATQKPVQLVANYLVGNRNIKNGQADCVIVNAGHRRCLDLSINVPGSPLSALMSNEVWEELYARLVELINTHGTTLVFVNTRRLSERLALALADRLGQGSVCSHHGSMSKEHRLHAEQQLKSGNLKVLVATASMELGIDIGSVDLVVQFSSPKSIATFLQRVGRSGHSIHGTPKGILFPLTRDDLVECTALLHSIQLGELDRIVMPEMPSDILCQQIVAEVAASDESGSLAGREIDSLYTLFSAAFPYRDLTRKEFHTLIQMLAEGYTTRRGRRGTYLHLDLINNRVRPRRGSGLVALTNGGAIPDMFDYQVVLDPEDIVVGSLNEDFALEALPGDIFTLGTHSWQLLRIDGLKVRVRDAQGMPPTIPFWFGEGPGRTRELSEAVSRLRQLVADRFLADRESGAAKEESINSGVRWLQEETQLEASAARQLLEYLQTGMQALGTMPTRETLVMERFFDEVGDMHVVIHSPYGSRVNRGWGLALRKRFCRTFNFELQAAANEDSIVISLGSVHSFPLEEVFSYLSTNSLRDVLVQALLDAPMFEVRWRWNATRSLAIQRNRSGKRVPPQFQRMDAEDLVAQVFPDQIACFENIQGKREVPDHPLVNQTIHDCLTEAMDIEALTELIAKMETNSLQLIAMDLREPSPFAQEIINARPYAFLDDAPFEERRTNAIKNRGWLDPSEIDNLAKLDMNAIRLVKEQAWPHVSNIDEMHDALLSLAYITDAEVKKKDYVDMIGALVAANRASRLQTESQVLWIAAERIPMLMTAFSLATVAPLPVLPSTISQQAWTVENAVREIVRGRLEGMGPVTARQLAEESGLSQLVINAGLLALEVEGFVFQGQFSSATLAGEFQQNEREWCERRLLQRIHRYTIDAHRRSVKPVSLQVYTQYLFDLHQIRNADDDSSTLTLARTLDGQTQLQTSLKLMDGIAAPAACWEADIFPSRIKDYDPGWLDVMCISGRVAWGRFVPALTNKPAQEKRRGGPIKSTPITFSSRENLDIWQALGSSRQEENETGDIGNEAARVVQDLQDHGASFFSDIQSRTGLLKTQLEQGLAELVSLGRASSDSFTGLRALLTPGDRKPDHRSRRGRRAMFGIEDAGRWSLLDMSTAGSGSGKAEQEYVLNEKQLERLAIIYLQRWGVVFRKLLERESFTTPWRLLLKSFRKMELQGVVRGGHFISGVGGEQFAFSDTVDALRNIASKESKLHSNLVSLVSADPLNLLSILLPEARLPRLPSNRILFENGIPLAVLQSGQVNFLRDIAPMEQWRLKQLLLKRQTPPRLRSYLGA